MKPVPQPAY